MPPPSSSCAAGLQPHRDRTCRGSLHQSWGVGIQEYVSTPTVSRRYSGPGPIPARESSPHIATGAEAHCMKQCAASLRLHNAHIRRDSSPCTAEACATISRSHRRAAGLRSPFLQGQQALNCCRRFSLSCQELCSVSGLWLSHGGTQRELESKVGRQRTQLKDMGTSEMHTSILVQAGWRRLAVPPQTACIT